MARGSIFAAIIFITLTTGVYTQFYDFFQALQPLVQSYPPLREISAYDTSFTTKKPKTASRHRTTGYSEQSKSRDSSRRNPATHISVEGTVRDDPRRKEKQTLTHVEVSSTSSPKPSRKTNRNSSRRIVDNDTNDNPKQSSSHGTSRNTARGIASNQKEVSRGGSRTSGSTRISANEPLLISNAFSYDNNDRKKLNYYESSTKPNYNYNSHQSSSNSYNKWTKINNYNTHTTQTPFDNRPGVRPASVDDRRPPMTNKPPTRKPAYEMSPRPTGAGAIEFPTDTGTSPELIIGPDEEYMTDVERRRHLEMSERMCDRYKNLNTKQLQAIPLVPSPVPVKINVSTCVPTNIPLVVGGKVVSIKEFPHMALIGWMKLQTSGYAWRCGGSLVSNQFVLTAAHCAYEERDNSIVMGTPTVVQLGSSYLDDPGALVVKVSAVVRHPKYKQPSSYYDIALIKLANTVTFSEVIKPACLGVPPRPNESVIASGWGRTEFGGAQSLELRSVSLHIWDMRECYNLLGKTRKLPNGPSSDSQICAGERKGGKDTCQGDSGGPAQIQDGCVWRVVAVTSVGRSCGAPNTPALYATVQRAFVASIIFGEETSSDNNRGETNNNNRGGIISNNYQANPKNNNGAGINNNNHQNNVNNNNRGGISNNNYQANPNNNNGAGINNNNHQSNVNNNYRGGISNNNYQSDTNNNAGRTNNQQNSGSDDRYTTERINYGTNNNNDNNNRTPYQYNSRYDQNNYNTQNNDSGGVNKRYSTPRSVGNNQQNYNNNNPQRNDNNNHNNNNYDAYNNQQTWWT